jgi:tRNA modification GTPase
MYNDTIAAIATPLGEGGIGIVRVSGPQACAILGMVFRHASRRRPASLESHRLYYGSFLEPATGRVLDRGLAVLMRAPHSYTGEDVVEFHTHGGIAAVRAVLEAALAAGARPAEPGEMTLRAFLNGKLDLAQAEAVMDVVRARTSEALDLAQRQLGGALSAAVRSLRGAAIDLLARLEATIDFSEDDVPPLEPAKVAQPLQQLAERARRLAETTRLGRVYREGLRVALVGRPNAGKSSLLNRLLGFERAIVTPIPGTTRDTVEDVANFRGVPVMLIDTAGITETDDPVERLGVERSRAALATADIVLYVTDINRALDAADLALAGAVGAARRDAPSRSLALVLNKQDLPALLDPQPLINALRPAAVVHTSALTGEGIDALVDTVRELALSGAAAPDAGAPVVTNVRHRDALLRAAGHFEAAAYAAVDGMAADFVCIDIRAGIEALGEITGESVTEDLLERIFSQFCIGK